LARVSHKRVRQATPSRAKAAASAAAPPARSSASGPTAGGAEASKRLEDLFAAYVNQNAPQTKRLTYSLKVGDQKNQSFNYPADLPAPIMRKRVGTLKYAGQNSQLLDTQLALKFLKLDNKYEVQAEYVFMGISPEVSANISPSTMTANQIYDYYQASLQAVSDVNVSTRIKKTFDSVDQAVKYVFGDVNGIEFFADEDLQQKVASDVAIKKITSGNFDYRFTPKANWALPADLQAEIKTH